MRALNFLPALAVYGGVLIAGACGTEEEDHGLPLDARSFASAEQYGATPDSNLWNPDSSDLTDEAIAVYRAPRLDSVVIYCWCLKNGLSTCMTFAAVKPAELCDPEKRLFTLRGEQAAGLRGLINSSETRRNVYGIPDARLVLQCFAGDSAFLLTYRTLEGRTLVVDGTRELYCKQPVLKWIGEAMGVNEINCPE